MASKKLVCHCNQALRAATTSAMKNSAEILENSKLDSNRNNLDQSFVIPKYSIKDEIEKVDRLDLTGEVCQKYQLYEEKFDETSRKRKINFIMPEPSKTPVLDPRDTHLAENRYYILEYYEGDTENADFDIVWLSQYLSQFYTKPVAS